MTLYSPRSATRPSPHILSALGDLSGKAVLDVCCGPGHLAAAAVQRGATAEGIDFAPTMVAKAARNYPAIPFREGDAESLPYEAAPSTMSSAPSASCTCSSEFRRIQNCRAAASGIEKRSITGLIAADRPREQSPSASDPGSGGHLGSAVGASTT
jgi:SAM-dependent methyltransferase